MTLLRESGPAGLVRAWRSFWFPPVSLGRLAVLRIVVGAYVVVDVLLGSWRLRYGAVAAPFYDPILLMQVLPRPVGSGIVALYGALLAAAVCATAGLAGRLSLPVTAALYLYWYASFYSYGETSNSRTVIAVALVALAMAPSTRVYAIDARITRRPAAVDEVAGWVFRLLTVLLVYLYLFAGIAKLTVTGTDWWRAGALEWGLVDGGTPAGLWLFAHVPWLVPLLALGGLVFELCAPVLLVPGTARLAYVGAAVAFHVAGLVLLDMDFLGMALVAVVVVTPAGVRRGPP